MTRILKLALVLAATLTLAACGTGPGSKQAAAPAASQEKTTAQATNTTTTEGPTVKADATEGRTGPSAGKARSGSGGEQAPNFAVTTLDGEKFQLSEKRGEVVALFFMAGWCSSCIPEAQSWDKLYSAYKAEGLELLIVSMDPNDTPQTIEGFRKAGDIGPLPWAIDKTGEVTRQLSIQALDSTVIVDQEGWISYQDSAPTPYETLDKELKEVL